MKASIAAASAAIVGSVAAAAHNNHLGFHMRRGDYDAGVCTAYTTVYVYPSEIPTAVANSTIEVYPTPVPETSIEVYPTPVPESSTPLAETSTSCTEEETSSTPAPQPTKEVYTPPPPPPPSSSSKVVEYTPSSKVPEYTPSKVPEYTPSSVYSVPPVYTPAPSPSSTKEVATPKPSPSKPADTPTYGGSGRIVTKGDKWAMTYTPYTAEGECKSLGEVQKDIKQISEMGFTTIRSYSTDCGVFEHVVPECSKYGLKVIYGIFLEAGGKGGKGPFSQYANDQLNEIIKNAPKDSVAMIIVGNESLFNGYCTPEELGSYIDYVKEQLAGAGFPSDIAVTTTEPVSVWEEQGAALCSHIDVFAVQIHPYFTSKVFASEAGTFAKEQLAQAAKVCPEAAEKGSYITEIGWPKKGNDNGNAKPGYAEQKEAIKDILEKVGKEACIFSAQDDLWKEPGSYGVEQSFGCAEAIEAASA